MMNKLGKFQQYSGSGRGVKRPAPSQQHTGNTSRRPPPTIGQPGPGMMQAPSGRPSGNAWWGASPPRSDPSGGDSGWRAQPAAKPQQSATGWGAGGSWSAQPQSWEQPRAAAPYRPGGRAGVYSPDAWEEVPPATAPGASWPPEVTGQPPPPSSRYWPREQQKPYSAQSRSYPDQPGGGWPAENYNYPQQPRAAATAPVTYPTRGPMQAEPAIGAAPPAALVNDRSQHKRDSSIEQEVTAAGDASSPAPVKITCSTRVVCCGPGRLPTTPDQHRWVVILGRLETSPPEDNFKREFVIRAPDGTRTQCVYYQSERPMATLDADKWVRCVGRLDKRGVFHCVAVRAANRQDIGLHRQLQLLAEKADNKPATAGQV